MSFNPDLFTASLIRKGVPVKMRPKRTNQERLDRLEQLQSMGLKTSSARNIVRHKTGYKGD